MHGHNRRELMLASRSGGYSRDSHWCTDYAPRATPVWMRAPGEPPAA
jgi:hypothetical protein